MISDLQAQIYDVLLKVLHHSLEIIFMCDQKVPLECQIGRFEGWATYLDVKMGNRLKLHISSPRHLIESVKCSITL